MQIERSDAAFLADMERHRREADQFGWATKRFCDGCEMLVNPEALRLRDGQELCFMCRAEREA